jgi:hypothetical protein
VIFILSVNFPEFRTGGDGLNCEFISAKTFVCLFVCLFACLFVCLFVCLFADKCSPVAYQNVPSQPETCDSTNFLSVVFLQQCNVT